MYNAFARNKLMGADPTWTRSLFGFALVPDLVLYLKVDLASLIPRALEGKGMDYWESGMHLASSSDLFESFCNYQRRLIREFNGLGQGIQLHHGRRQKIPQCDSEKTSGTYRRFSAQARRHTESEFGAGNRACGRSGHRWERAGGNKQQRPICRIWTRSRPRPRSRIPDIPARMSSGARDNGEAKAIIRSAYRSAAVAGDEAGLRLTLQAAQEAVHRQGRATPRQTCPGPSSSPRQPPGRT